MLAKGVHFFYKKYDDLTKEIKELKLENLKLKDTLEEFKILDARKSDLLTMISNYLKNKFIDGLDDLIDKKDK